MNNQPVRRFKMIFADLIARANATHNFVMRDIDEFINFGITQADIDDFKTEINALEEMPTDLELHTDIGVAVENKKKLRKELEKHIRRITMRAAMAFDTSSQEYLELYTGRMTTMGANDFLINSRRIARNAQKYLTELAVFGLTQAIIDDFNAKNDAFENAITTVFDARTKRSKGTLERIEKGNSIYETTVKLCELGKKIWRDVNPAKYRDYVVYSKKK